MILGALDGVGGQAYLKRQAEENPGPFLTLMGRFTDDALGIPKPHCGSITRSPT